MTLNPETTDYWAAREIAEDRKTTVEKVQIEARHRAELPGLLSRQTSVLEKEKDRLAREQSKLEHREAELLGLTEQWESLITSFESLRSELSFAAGQAEQVAPEAWRIVARQRAWGQKNSPFGYAESILHFYGLAAAAQIASEDYQIWRIAKEADLCRVADELRAFARQHGCESKLPSELQGK